MNISAGSFFFGLIELSKREQEVSSMVIKEHTLKTTAVYSADQKDRYSLTKVWNEDKPKAIIG